MTQASRERASRNRTIRLSKEEEQRCLRETLQLTAALPLDELAGAIINQDLFEALEFLPTGSVDLLVIDPPYNLTKRYNTTVFRQATVAKYEEWFSSWFDRLMPVLKSNASVYICCDWRSSGVVERVAGRHLTLRNRITWEREKGRGAHNNWKNCSEDIWFGTVSDDYTFNVDAVKLKRRVIAPYRSNGKPKDWQESAKGNFRLSFPSNLWTDLTVPFWSMPENTDHPTQKPEKLLAKIILASSKPGDLVFDPFLGSGSSAVTALKLGRRYAGVEIDPGYCALAVRRLAMAASDTTIQGFNGNSFEERNFRVSTATAPERRRKPPRSDRPSLFAETTRAADESDNNKIGRV